MTELKIKFSLSMNPKLLATIEDLRGNFSRSLAIEAMLMDYLGFPDDEAAFGLRR
jgi:hypothetical protein